VIGSPLGDVAAQLITWQFGTGFLIGLAVQRLWCWRAARRLDRTAPLPDGRRHKLNGLNRVWVAGALVAFIMGWVMMQTQDTANRTDQVIRDQRECSRQFNAALAARSVATQYDNKLDKLNERDRDATRQWLFTLLNPPPEIADLDEGDPARSAFGLSITRQYLGTIEEVRKQRVALTRERDSIRERNPYPDPTCGK
jgi:hypothetical protein